MRKLDLAVVMPVFNEEACIQPVLEAWLHELAELNISFRLLVLNDGSRDGTAPILDGMASPQLQVIHKANSGHGPTILHGYHAAVDLADWVFQVDSDDELRPSDFRRFWASRDGHDLVIGHRVERSSPWGGRSSRKGPAGRSGSCSARTSRTSMSPIA